MTVLNSGKIFTSLDLGSGYWPVPIAPEDKNKTAFITDQGLFEFSVMPFGLTNAPATFQRLMDAVLSGLKWNILLVYLDDNFVCSPTFNQNLVDLRTTFDRLRHASLRLKASKCHCFQRELFYLGHIVSAAETSPDSATNSGPTTSSSTATNPSPATGSGSFTGSSTVHLQPFVHLQFQLLQRLVNLLRFFSHACPFSSNLHFSAAGRIASMSPTTGSWLNAIFSI